MTGPPPRRSRGGNPGSGSAGGGPERAQDIPAPPDHEYDEAVTDLVAVVTTSPQSEAEWAATLDAVETGALDLDDVVFPPGQEPFAAIPSTRGGWKVVLG